MSIYDDIGGKEAVDAAVNILYTRLLDDKNTSHFFDGMDVAKQRMKMRLFLTYALGGAAQYNGKDLRTSHAHLNLTDQDFDNVGGHIKATLEELCVPGHLVDSILSVVETTRDEIVNRASAA
ncbi:group 1 truncated hemoglobin [Stappia sp. GBMRC 2046]|uniref:Group 1 truncated hemoglobin n=1 Tax=Stappia sediminis TaxID=2692190 RepID=A0A7X3LX84_9HYPH|nr:group 1 truncated hemoglobin [Stappia sediminis]MXN66730.1 group 1 truncated hemoglobin [Stappia sediminis]